MPEPYPYAAGRLDALEACARALRRLMAAPSLQVETLEPEDLMALAQGAAALEHLEERDIQHGKRQPMPHVPLWPCLIFSARYGGAYEGGTWIALHNRNAVPPDAWSGDPECLSWFTRHRHAPWLGVGDTPNAALEHLHDRQPQEP